MDTQFAARATRKSFHMPSGAVLLDSGPDGATNTGEPRPNTGREVPMRATIEGILLGAARLPAPSPLPREVIEERAIEAAETVVPRAVRESGEHLAQHPRFPKTAEVLALCELADKCRCCAASLEAIASNAGDYEIGTLRRLGAGMVRALYAELALRVVL